MFRVFDVMQRANWHVFQVLTKRHDRLADLAPVLPWPPNVWMGVTIENRRFVHRADRLREVTRIDWLIAAGKSGRWCALDTAPSYVPFGVRGDHDPLVLGVPAGVRSPAGTLKPREIRA